MAVLAAVALSGFFGRAAVFDSNEASGLVLEIALSFLETVLTVSLSEVNGLGFDLLSLYGAAASLAEESRLSVVIALDAGLRGSFLETAFFFTVESSFTSPSSSSSEL